VQGVYLATGEKSSNAVLLFECFRYYVASVRTITCKIPEKLDTELEAIARRKKTSKSEVVRDAILTSIEREKDQVRLSAHDLMQEGCGIVRGPERDRSWNRKRLEGFGRD
jgi:Arc/MetJ-type ribon-helix-helix transcriptional regulator